MTNRVDLDASAHLLSAGVLPFDDGSGYQVRITIRTEPDRTKPDMIEIGGYSEERWVRFAVADWPKVRDTLDRLVEFTGTLLES